MSAFAYIEKSDLPHVVWVKAVQRVEGSDKLIAFDGCPLTGAEQDDGEIQFPWPRSSVLRGELVGWLFHWGLSFRVEM